MILAAVLAVLGALFHWLGRDERVVVLKLSIKCHVRRWSIS
jgi:hypothetical protein